MSFRRFPAALLSAWALAACTLFAGFDGFSGADDPAADAGDAGDTAFADVTDATSAADAGADARFCAAFPDAGICQDFDDDVPLKNWTQSMQPGSTIMLANDKAASPPRSIRASVAPYDVSRYAHVSRAVTGVVSHARLSYALFVELRPSTSEIEVNILQFVCGPPCRTDFYLAINPTGAHIVEQFIGADGGVTSNYHDIGTAIPTGKWLRVELEVVLSGTRILVLTVDGVEVARKDLTFAMPGPAVVNAGITYASKNVPSAALLVDDVVYEALP